MTGDVKISDFLQLVIELHLCGAHVRILPLNPLINHVTQHEHIFDLLLILFPAFSYSILPYYFSFSLLAH